MKRWPKRIGLIVLTITLLIGLLIGYAYLIEPDRLVVTNAEIRINGWDKGFDGLKFVMISDIHGGSHGGSVEKIRRVVELSNAQEPDVVVLLGDYVSHAQIGTFSSGRPIRMPMQEVADNLAGLRARHGVYAVLGNHDGWHDDAEVARELTRVGYRVLQNEIAVVQQNGSTLRLFGLKDHLKLDSWLAFDATVRSVVNSYPKDGQIVVLEHSPDMLYVMNFWKHLHPDLKLMLAGHTHGGQVWLPVIGAPVVPSSVGQRYASGHIEEEGVHMFVTTGVGTSILPFRFMVPPEIAVVTVRSN